MFELDKKNMKKIMILIFFAIILFLGIQNIKVVGDILTIIFRVLSPFIIGICVAFILNIPVKFFERIIIKYKKRVKTKKNKGKEKISITTIERVLTISISIILIIVIIYLMFVLIIPELLKAFEIFKNNIPIITSTLQGWLEKITIRYPEIYNKISTFSVDWSNVTKKIFEFLKTGVGGAAITTSINFIISFITGVVNFFIGFIFAIYVLAQKEKLTFQIKKIIYAYMRKDIADKIFKVASVSNDKFSSYFSGQLTDAFLLGCMCFLGMVVFKMPYALTVSVVVGFCAIIPMFGSFIGGLIGVILIAVVSPMEAFWFLIFLLVIQQIDGNLLYPRVVGNSVGLPGIWVMVAVTIGGSLMGVLGMIVGVPLASVIYTLLRSSVNQKIKEKSVEI